MKSYFILIACLSALIIGCKEESKETRKSDSKFESFTDSRDGKTYKTVKIGDQIWMAENLAYLPRVSPGSYGSNVDPFYYVYRYQGNNINEAKSTDNYQTYGVLYNWPAAIDACPSGWHLPSDEEWTTLTDYLGGENVAGGKLKEKGKAHWKRPNKGATNESGFTALPGGGRYEDGLFRVVNLGSWWSASEFKNIYAWYRSMSPSYSNVARSSYLFKEDGFSVRCVRD